MTKISNQGLHEVAVSMVTITAKYCLEDQVLGNIIDKVEVRND